MNIESQDPRRVRLNRLSRFMDSSIRLPGGFRIGWDGVIGLIPGLGDIVGLGVSSYIVVGAARLGASKATLFRMLINLALESVIGAVPLVGDIFDMVFKANNRNMALLEKQMASPEATTRASNAQLIGAGVVLLLLILLVLWIVIRLLGALFGAIF